MTYLSFAKATLERAVRTFAQALAALLVADGTDLLNTAWSDRLSVAGMAAVLSVLTSIAAAPIGQTGPSLLNEAIVPPADPADAPDASIHGGRLDTGYGAIELLVVVILVLIAVYLVAALV